MLPWLRDLASARLELPLAWPERSPLRSSESGEETLARGNRSVRFAALGPEEIAGGWFLPGLHDQPDIGLAVRALPKFDGHHLVAAHFNQQTGRFEADGQEYTLTGFAGRLRRLPGWVPGTPLILVACVTVTPEEMAGFAAALGSNVLAGTGDVWYTRAGEVVVAPAVSTGREGSRPDLRRPGPWRLTYADGSPSVSYFGSLRAAMEQITGLSADRQAPGQPHAQARCALRERSRGIRIRVLRGRPDGGGQFSRWRGRLGQGRVQERCRISADAEPRIR